MTEARLMCSKNQGKMSVDEDPVSCDAGTELMPQQVRALRGEVEGWDLDRHEVKHRE